MATARMEERLAGATKRAPPSPIEDPNWPMRCICNLCDCGGHRCSNFAIEGTASEELRHLQQTRHCCNYMAANERYLSGGEAREKPAASERSASTDTSKLELATTANGAGHRRSGQVGGKLTGSAQRASKEGEPSGRQSDGAAQELLRVLVARPEIARPRDNIVFEGDMDLKTTFETSYEALARMRLDHWRRYQEEARRAVGGEQQQQQQQRRRRQDGPNTGDCRWGPAKLGNDDDDEEEEGQRELGGQTNVSVELSKQSARPKGGPARVSPGGRREADNDVIGRPIHGQQPLVDSQPACGGGPAMVAGQRRRRQCQTNNQSADARGGHNEASGATSRLSGADKQQTVAKAAATAAAAAAAVAASPESGDGNLRAKTSNQRQQQQQRVGDDDFIDPDLSSIIVFDANMNRLERVGLRKRSKYRPSTSLRTGTRGLFGDQRESLEEGAKLEASRQSGTTRLGGADSRQQETITVSSHAAGVTSQAMEARSESRNQKHAREFVSGHGADYDNVQIEGRRRLPRNINMTDHIKEQHLVDNPEEANHRDKATLTEHMPAEPIRDADETASLVDGEQIRRLVEEEEEAAAVAEIQRCTLDDLAATPRPQEEADKPEVIMSAERQQLGETSRNSTTRSTSNELQRQSRMQRVCQNQSFYLFENDYPQSKGLIDEEKFKIGRDSGELARHQQQRPSDLSTPMVVKKNLFRESPDFMLARGSEFEARSLNQRQSAATTTKRRQNASVDLTKKRSADYYYADQVTGASPAPDDSKDQQNGFSSSEKHQLDRTPQRSPESDGYHVSHSQCRKCRVLDLEQDYEFVGLRSGHKYFVEKQLNATPTSEMILN